jgi:hypothetical protein
LLSLWRKWEELMSRLGLKERLGSSVHLLINI